jgi:DNA mismatch repair ATPase MutS
VNTYDKLQKDVSVCTIPLTTLQVKSSQLQLKEDVVPELARLKTNEKTLTQEVSYIESKLNNLESNLPDIVKEIFDYFITKKDQQDREMYVSH